MKNFKSIVLVFLILSGSNAFALAKESCSFLLAANAGLIVMRDTRLDRDQNRDVLQNAIFNRYVSVGAMGILLRANAREALPQEDWLALRPLLQKFRVGDDSGYAFGADAEALAAYFDSQTASVSSLTNEFVEVYRTQCNNR